MKKIGLVAICLLVLHTVKAQRDEDSVKAAVNALFIGMATSDSAAIVNSFNDDAILQSINEKEGKTTVVNEKAADFGHAIAALQKGDADERIKFNAIKIDGPLAMVWAPYNFYYKGKFSHCGADFFGLVRKNGVWKIQYLIDTRRKDGCKN